VLNRFYSDLAVVDDVLEPEDDVLKVAVFDFGDIESGTAPARENAGRPLVDSSTPCRRCTRARARSLGRPARRATRGLAAAQCSCQLVDDLAIAEAALGP
jgi:hypothetical protein